MKKIIIFYIVMLAGMALGQTQISDLPSDVDSAKANDYFVVDEVNSGETKKTTIEAIRKGLAAATTSAKGLMTAAQKSRLDSISAAHSALKEINVLGKFNSSAELDSGGIAADAVVPSKMFDQIRPLTSALSFAGAGFYTGQIGQAGDEFYVYTSSGWLPLGGSGGGTFAYKYIVNPRFFTDTLTINGTKIYKSLATANSEQSDKFLFLSDGEYNLTGFLYLKNNIIGGKGAIISITGTGSATIIDTAGNYVVKGITVINTNTSGNYPSFYLAITSQSRTLTLQDITAYNRVCGFAISVDTGKIFIENCEITRDAGATQELLLASTGTEVFSVINSKIIDYSTVAVIQNSIGSLQVNGCTISQRNFANTKGIIVVGNTRTGVVNNTIITHANLSGGYSLESGGSATNFYVNNTYANVGPNWVGGSYRIQNKDALFFLGMPDNYMATGSYYLADSTGTSFTDKSFGFTSTHIEIINQEGSGILNWSFDGTNTHGSIDYANGERSVYLPLKRSKIWIKGDAANINYKLRAN